jgi:hypothetical protein
VLKRSSSKAINKSPAPFQERGFCLLKKRNASGLVAFQRSDAVVDILDGIFAAAVDLIFQG